MSSGLYPEADARSIAPAPVSENLMVYLDAEGHVWARNPATGIARHLTGRLPPNEIYLLVDGSRPMEGPLILAPGLPNDPRYAANKNYVDDRHRVLQDQIDLLLAGQVFIGSYDVVNDSAIFISSVGIPGTAPLPPASYFLAGHYVICISAGLGHGNAPAEMFGVGDQIFSDGTDWVHVKVGGPIVTAMQVAIVPAINAWEDVQEALDGLWTGKINKAGDVMTGLLYLAPIAPFAPDHAAAKWYVDLMVDTAVKKTGDNMTGRLVIGRQGPLTLGGASRAGAPTESWQIELAGGPRSAWISSTCDFGGGAGVEGAAIHFWTDDWQGTVWPTNAVWCGKFGNGGLALGHGSLNAPALKFGHGPNWNYTANGLYMPDTGTIAVVIAGQAVFNFNGVVNNSIKPLTVGSNSPSLPALRATTVGGGAPIVTSGGHIIMSDDGMGLLLFGNGAYYKRVGTGLVIRLAVGNTPLQIENNDGSNLRQVIDQVIGDARYLLKSGDTMAGALQLNSGVQINSGGILQLAGNVRLRSTGTGPDGGQVIQWQDSAGRVTGQINTYQTGNIVGGNQEGRLQFHTMNGGWGWHRVMETTTNSPPQTSWSGALNAPAFNVSSDRRLKSDIVPADPEEAKTIFDAVTPVRFKRIDNEEEPDRLYWGLIADDFAAVAPDMVQKDDQGLLSYDLGAAVSVTVSLLKSQQVQIAKQAEVIELLQEQLATLEERFSNKMIADLEGQVAKMREQVGRPNQLRKQKPQLPEK